jgi:hypothetical protein
VIPEEIRKAIEQAETWQAESWLNLTTEISGVEVEHMTLKHFLLLDGVSSPFIKNTSFSPTDIGLFLWILSPKYSMCPKARQVFIEEIFDLNIGLAVEGITEYLTLTFQDAESTDSKDKKYANFVAYMVDLFGREYGWNIKYILNLPMRQIYQLSTAIGERYAKQAGENYTKLRAIDMMEAQALLDQARKAKAENN